MVEGLAILFRHDSIYRTHNSNMFTSALAGGILHSSVYSWSKLKLEEQSKARTCLGAAPFTFSDERAGLSGIHGIE